ncbi:hypothetical protein, partial [Tardiphaga sp. P5_C10]
VSAMARYSEQIMFERKWPLLAQSRRRDANLTYLIWPVFDVAPRSSGLATFVEIAVAIDRIHLRAAALREMFSAKV